MDGEVLATAAWQAGVAFVTTARPRYDGVLEGARRGRGEGFISESWIAAEFRGGMDLPLC